MSLISLHLQRVFEVWKHWQRSIEFGVTARYVQEQYFSARPIPTRGMRASAGHASRSTAQSRFTRNPSNRIVLINSNSLPARCVLSDTQTGFEHCKLEVHYLTQWKPALTYAIGGTSSSSFIYHRLFAH